MIVFMVFFKQNVNRKLTFGGGMEWEDGLTSRELLYVE